MSRRMFEFACTDGHVEEKLVDDHIRITSCSCGRSAQRIVSAPGIKLEGISGAFPGAYSRWERVRAERLQQERKQKASHGEE